MAERLNLEIGRSYNVDGIAIGKSYFLGTIGNNCDLKYVFANGDVQGRKGNVKISIIPVNRIRQKGKSISDIGGNYITWQFIDFWEEQPALIRDIHSSFMGLMEKESFRHCLGD